MKLSIIV